MELLFTKKSYSHGRGMEKANQIHAVQKSQQPMGEGQEISDRVRDDFMLPGAAMRVDEGESLAEDTLKSRALSVQGRERRWHVLYTSFNGGKSNSETKGL